MALDYGERRVGVAITDETGLLALPLETISGARGEQLFARLAELLREYRVDTLVLGLPLHMDGAAGQQAAATRRFGEELEKRSGLPVHYLDERGTSREAERVLGDAGASPKRRRARRERTDPVAAALILRTWLDRQGAR